MILKLYRPRSCVPLVATEQADQEQAEACSGQEPQDSAEELGSEPCQAQASHWPRSEDLWPLIGRCNPLRAPWRLLIRIGFKLFSSSLYSSPT